MLGKIGLDSRYLAQKSIRPPLFNARSLSYSKNISIVNKIKIEARCSLKILLEIYRMISHKIMAESTVFHSNIYAPMISPDIS